jgi:hypothetical protein
MEESIGQVYCIFVLDRKVVRFPTEIASAILSLLHDETSRFYGSNEPFTAADRNNLAFLGSFLEGWTRSSFFFSCIVVMFSTSICQSVSCTRHSGYSELSAFPV